jgi:hypothetical protein
MGEGGDHVDNEKLKEILENLNREQINDACKTHRILHDFRNIIREDIDKLLSQEVTGTEGESIKPVPRSSAAVSRTRSISTLTDNDGEQMEPSQESRSISTLTADEAPQKNTRMAPVDYIDNAWRYVQSIGSRTSKIDIKKLDIILKNIELEHITRACNTDRLLKMRCNAIHNKIRDLKKNWNKSIRGGKRSRRSSKKSNKRKSHKKKQF